MLKNYLKEISYFGNNTIQKLKNELIIWISFKILSTYIYFCIPHILKNTLYTNIIESHSICVILVFRRELKNAIVLSIIAIIIIYLRNMELTVLRDKSHIYIIETHIMTMLPIDFFLRHFLWKILKFVFVLKVIK